MFIKSDYSMFASSLSTGKAIKLALEKGYKEVVLCDNNMYAVLEFYYEAKKNKLKPIIALLKNVDNVEYLFISHNSKGYSELTKAESLGNFDELFVSGNITAVATDINVLNKDIKINIQSKYSSLIEELNSFDKIKNQMLKKHEVLPIVIANGENVSDIHLIAAMKCIDPNAEVSSVDRMKMIMQDRLSVMPESVDIDMTKLEVILSKCEDDYSFGNPVPPEFIFGKEMGLEFGLDNPSNDDLFEFMCKRGLKERLGGVSNKVYEDRLEVEMNIIKNMKFSGYMLIVFDFIKYAKDNKIPVGPGRGSAAGSLVCYSLFITNIDPIPYNLLFERFLNPERVSLPDIDIDFCKDRREEVIAYVVNKYGKERVAQVITFSKIGPRSGIRDVARIKSIPVSIASNIVKLIPDTIGIDCKTSYEDNKEAFDLRLESDFAAREIWPLVCSLEGFKKQTGIHAAGLVISNDSIYNRAPVYKSGDINLVGYDGKYLEDVNLVKYDFLGLRTLTIIDNTVKSIKKNLNIDLNPYNLPLDNEEVFKYISKGTNSGMFQIESSGMQDLARKLQPSNFEEIIAMLALYRPGPMEAGMLDSFIDRKHGREEIDYFFKDMETALKPILEPTYGLIVYQEQVMQIVQSIAGFSLGEADLVRRAMGKKKIEEMNKLSKEFTERSVARGYKAEEAESLFHLIEKFAGYGFNKSHSAAYAMITYVTAYLKYFYPASFMSNLINGNIEDVEKVAQFVNEAKSMGIKVYNPDVVNGSEYFSENEDKKEIIFGLKGVKSVGSGAKTVIRAIKKFDKKISFIDLIKYLQRDVSSELTKKTSEFKKSLKKIERLNKKMIDNISKNEAIIERAKKRLKGDTSLSLTLTVSESGTHGKRISENEDIIKELQVEAALHDNILNDISALELEKSNIVEGENSKINKTTLEVLAKIGAFSAFELTRKDIIDNIELLLKYSTIDQVVFSGKEISEKEKILNELEYLGLVLTEPFDRDVLNGREISDGFFIGIILDTVVKKTKAGKEYNQYVFLTSNGDRVSLNDFNGKFKNKTIGDKIIVQFTVNEAGFTNILKAMEYSVKNIEAVSYETEGGVEENADREINIAESIIEMNVKVLTDLSTIKIPASVRVINILDIDNSLLMKISI